MEIRSAPPAQSVAPSGLNIWVGRDPGAARFALAPGSLLQPLRGPSAAARPKPYSLRGPLRCVA